MKFSEIPQLISGGAYEVNYSLASVPRVLEEWQTESGLILNPDFQRGRVWTDAQQSAFMEYYLRGGRSGMTIFFNQPSWQSLDSRTERAYDDFVCVDGLQRLTAVVRFLGNEVPAFGQLYVEFKEDIRHAAGNFSGLRFNINNLQTRAQVLTWYLQINDGGTPHTAEEISRVRGLLHAEQQRQAARRPAGQLS